MATKFVLTVRPVHSIFLNRSLHACAVRALRRCTSRVSVCASADASFCCNRNCFLWPSRAVLPLGGKPMIGSPAGIPKRFFDHILPTCCRQDPVAPVNCHAWNKDRSGEWFGAEYFARARSCPPKPLRRRFVLEDGKAFLRTVKAVCPRQHVPDLHGSLPFRCTIAAIAVSPNNNDVNILQFDGKQFQKISESVSLKEVGNTKTCRGKGKAFVFAHNVCGLYHTHCCTPHTPA